MSATDFKTTFIEAAIASGVLLFGEFTLKSGRLRYPETSPEQVVKRLHQTEPRWSKSPYFFNAGLLYDGPLLSATAEAFASTIQTRLPEFDVLFGPAYKGIPLSAITTVALANRGVPIKYTYNRKEKKDHGEGGTLVGAPLANSKVVIIDDVMTAGTAIRESIAILREQPGAQLVGIVQLLDRQERGKGATSTIQEVEAEFGVPVVPIVNLQDIIAYLKAKPGYEAELQKIEAYRAEFGVQA